MHHIEEVYGNNVVLEVIGNSLGIAYEFRTRIIEPFVSSQNGIDNLGLGLAIVNNIISSYQGRIEIVFGLDSGTVVKIIFPTITKEGKE